MGQISPRAFEAIAMGTGMVLYEGNYSGILIPWEHYIPLKKDWSNIDEVLHHVLDDALLAPITRRAYNDVIVSGKYGYRTLVREIDKAVASHVGRLPRARLVSAVVAVKPLSAGPPVSLLETEGSGEKAAGAKRQNLFSLMSRLLQARRSPPRHTEHIDNYVKTYSVATDYCKIPSDGYLDEGSDRKILLYIYKKLRNSFFGQLIYDAAKNNKQFHLCIAHFIDKVIRRV
ncbi:MAG: hypothetical protein LBJ82_06650 [Deltaproteobacteria bacterium]|nr:hypothetical protein [Deltaproteobacteria bacterium]